MRNFIKCFLKIKIDYIYRWPIIHPFSYFFQKHTKFVRHDLAFRNPCWAGFISLCLMRKFIIWSLIIVSNNLQITDVKLTGLSFTDLFLEPFLNIGIMFASFHSKGTIPSCSYMLNMSSSGVLIYSTASFSIKVISHLHLVTCFLSYC